jgi:hypothetical protein
MGNGQRRLGIKIKRLAISRVVAYIVAATKTNSIMPSFDASSAEVNSVLEQKINGKSMSYIIDDAGLKRVIGAKYGASEYHMPFEQIKTNKSFVFEHNKSCLGLAIFFGALALFVLILGILDAAEPTAFPVWSLISAGLFVIYYRSRGHKLFIETTDGNSLVFILTNQNSEAVIAFADLLIQARNKYLLSKYSQLNRNLEYGGQLENLNWLLNTRALTKEQYDAKVVELNTIFHTHTGNKPIGFATSN